MVGDMPLHKVERFNTRNLSFNIFYLTETPTHDSLGNNEIVKTTISFISDSVAPEPSGEKRVILQDSR